MKEAEVNTPTPFACTDKGSNKHLNSKALKPLKTLGIEKTEILKSLVKQFKRVDFAKIQYPNVPAEDLKDKKVNRNEMRVIILKEIIKQSKINNWNLCKQGGFCYLYNGAYWETLNDDDLKHFLSDCSKAMGLKETTADDYKFVDELYKQFLFSAHLQPLKFDRNTVLINLQNGTFRITKDSQKLMPFVATDFLTYQLPFEYNPLAKAPIFETYLNRVLPDVTAQNLLAEYCGYLFIRHGAGLKFEKCLILYGGGANGKSVFFEVLTALLGKENISTYPLSDLTDKNGYHRAEIANKLLNYASEISKEMNTDLFKKLASGERFTARSPYGKPFEVDNYAKLIFNANQLPTDVEQTNAFFRRFLIIPFDVTIPEAEQDRELHIKIISNELAGVFNWVYEGLKRLLENKNFTECKASIETLKTYQTESDSVKMFLSERNYQTSNTIAKLLSEVYSEYKSFCNEDGYRACGNKIFSKRLTNAGFEVEKPAGARVVYIQIKDETETEIKIRADDKLPF